METFIYDYKGQFAALTFTLTVFFSPQRSMTQVMLCQMMIAVAFDSLNCPRKSLEGELRKRITSPKLKESGQSDGKCIIERD